MCSPQKIELTTPANRCKFEVQPHEAAAVPSLAGYAIVFNVVSSDDRRARIAPGAVRFIDPGPVLALYGHDAKDVLGSTANNTLRITQDDYGVRVEIDPPATSVGRDVAELVAKGYVTGMSFGMYPQNWTDSQEAGETVRTYTEIVVDEVTITAVPAFPQTTIGLRFGATPDRDAHTLRIEEYRLRNFELN